MSSTDHLFTGQARLSAGTRIAELVTFIAPSMSERNPRTVDDIAIRADISANAVRRMLSELAEAGRAVESERGWRLVSTDERDAAALARYEASKAGN